jgi:hypothetical protein
MVDDGAIVLRYMDNFAAGGFYRYNLSDPPVFGVSGFIHAILAGVFAASRVVTPEQSLLVSNALGVALSAFASLLILRQFSSSLLSILAGWIFVMSSCFFFLSTAFQGLEAPLHLGIVLLAVWSFLAGRRTMLWALLALSVVSKLDAVPIAFVLAVLRMASLRDKQERLAELRSAVLWCCIPLIVWVIFAALVFGSPLPQSAYAKMYFHNHSHARIGFLLPWWTREEERIATYLLIVAIAVAASFFRRRLNELPRLLAMPFASASILVMFMIFNPGERMGWYYVLPQALLVLAAVVSVLALVRPAPRIVSVVICLGILGATIKPTVAKTIRFCQGSIKSIRQLEPERIAIGCYVNSVAEADDKLMTGHGYVARYARIYVYDSSGLNSPEVTRLRKQHRSPMKQLAPDWSVTNVFFAPHQQKEYNITLNRTFYRRSSRGRAAWRIWRYGNGPVARPATIDEIATDDLIIELPDLVTPPLLHVKSSKRIVLTYLGKGHVSALLTGVLRREKPYTVTIESVASSAESFVSTTYTIPPIDAADLAEGNVFEVRIPINQSRTAKAGIAFSAAGESGSAVELHLLEPVWMITDFENDSSSLHNGDSKERVEHHST